MLSSSWQVSPPQPLPTTHGHRGGVAPPPPPPCIVPATARAAGAEPAAIVDSPLPPAVTERPAPTVRHLPCTTPSAVTAVAAPYRRSLRLGPYRRHQAWSAAPRPLRLLGGGGRLAHPATGRHSAVAWAPVWLDGVLLP